MAQILMPRQKKDGLDKLAQVLGIINTGFGIKTNFDKQTLINKQQEAEAALAPQREEQAGLKNQLLSAQVSTEKNRGGLAQKAREASLQQELAKEQRSQKFTLGRDREKEKVATDTRSLKNINEVVKERNRSPITQDTQKIVNSFQRVLATQKTAAGDLALVFNFMKMLDPGSVVRESEFANAENAAGVPDKIRNKWNKMLSGERLAPQQKKNFINQSGSIFKGQIISQNRFDKSMVDAAKSRGVATDQSIFTKFDIPNDVLEKSFARLGIENKKTVIPKNLQKTHSVLSKLTGSKNKADIMNRIDEIMKKRKNTANTGFKRSGMSGREL